MESYGDTPDDAIRNAQERVAHAIDASTSAIIEHVTKSERRSPQAQHLQNEIRRSESEEDRRRQARDAFMAAVSGRRGGDSSDVTRSLCPHSGDCNCGGIDASLFANVSASELDEWLQETDVNKNNNGDSYTSRVASIGRRLSLRLASRRHSGTSEVTSSYPVSLPYSSSPSTAYRDGSDARRAPTTSRGDMWGKKSTSTVDARAARAAALEHQTAVHLTSMAYCQPASSISHVPVDPERPSRTDLPSSKRRKLQGDWYTSTPDSTPISPTSPFGSRKSDLPSFAAFPNPPPIYQAEGEQKRLPANEDFSAANRARMDAPGHLNTMMPPIDNAAQRIAISDSRNLDDDVKFKSTVSAKMLPETTKKGGTAITGLSELMKRSQESQQCIHDWDRNMGLRRSHSKTMRASNRSRKKLLELQMQLVASGAQIPGGSEGQRDAHPCRRHSDSSGGLPDLKSDDLRQSFAKGA